MPETCPRCTTPVLEGAKYCGACGSPATPVSPASPRGHGGGPEPALPDRYRILRFLGRGGMGRVYLCQDTRLDVEVAIKVLPSDVAQDQDSLRQIEQEARAAAKLRACPGILALHGFEQHGEVSYLIMEYAAGGSLLDYLRENGHLAETECRRLGAEVAEALAFAHQMRVLHRDIKPANVLLDSQRRARVADFGIAKIMAETSARLSHATIAGTPIYMAPEVLLRSRVDQRSDLYSLGCMLFEMATGECPFEGGIKEIMAAKLVPGAVVPDPKDRRPEISEAFSQVVRRLMATDPDERFPDGVACAEALRRAGRDGRCAEITRPSPDRAPERLEAVEAELGGEFDRGSGVHPSSRWRIWAVLLAIGVLGVAGWASRRGQNPSDPGATGVPSPNGEGVSMGSNLEAPDPRSPARNVPRVSESSPGPALGDTSPRPGEDQEPPVAAGLLVVTDPPGASIAVDGVERGLAEGDGLLLSDLVPDRDYSIRATLAQHETVERRSVRWATGDRLVLRLPLPRLSGFIRLEGGPPGSRIRARREGSADIQLELGDDGTGGPVPAAVGIWRLELTRSGFHPWTGTVEVTAAGTATVAVSARELDGTLDLETDPGGAEVHSGPRFLGRTPLRSTPMQAGRHLLRVTHPEAEETVTEVVIRGGETTGPGLLRMTRLARLDLSNLPGGIVAEIDGRPVSGSQYRPAGELEIVWRKPKCRPLTSRVTLKSGESVSPPPPSTWEAAPGTLDLSALPDDCAVIVNGKAQPRGAERLIQVDPGTHLVALSRPGYEAVPEQSVPVRAEESVRVSNPNWVVKREDARNADSAPGDAHGGALPRLDFGLAAPPESTLRLQRLLNLGGLVRRDPDGRLFSARDGSEMVLIPAGTCEIGSLSGPEDERPRHNVEISALLMARCEVTVVQFARFVEETAYVTDAERRGSSFVLTAGRWSRTAGAAWRTREERDGRAPLQERMPITHVSWNDALAYCEWAGKRLPTEAEFERALRAGVANADYPWGDAAKPPAKLTNCADRSLATLELGWSLVDSYDDGHPRASVVGGYLMNSFGLFDVSGNLWEWCQDGYDPNYYKRTTFRDPVGPSESREKVLRGGAWCSGAPQLRCAARAFLNQSEAASAVGFRTAVSLRDAESGGK